MRLARSEGFLTSFAHRPWVRALALFSAVWLTGCTAYNNDVTLTPQPHPSRVMVKTLDDWRVQVDAARIEGDSLFGTQVSCWTRERIVHSVADTLVVGSCNDLAVVPVVLSRVQSIQGRGFSAGRSLGLVGAVAVGAFLVFLMTFDIQGDCGALICDGLRWPSDGGH